MQVNIQIGKHGLTSGIIENLKNIFKIHELVRISVLKSSGRDSEKTREMAEKIVSELGKNYVFRVVGFVIIMRKLRKPKRE